MAQLPAWGELRTLPNLITVARIALIPVFLATYLSRQVGAAAITFAVAAATDLIDGTLARLLKQKTTLGAILDPLADKLLGVAALAALVAHGRLPLWLLALSLARDLVVLTMALAAKWETVPAVSPSRIGKYATFATNGAVIVALVGEISYSQRLSGYVAAAAIIAGECLAVAALQYAWRFAATAHAAGAD